MRNADESMIALTKEPIDHADLLEKVRDNRAGAICSFLGTVREFTGDKQTSFLVYEAYHEMAEKKMIELEQEACRRWPIAKLALVHRVGRLELGQVSVAVVVSCPHRDQAFEACRWLIDTIKSSVPIWKKELFADGNEEWVHPETNLSGTLPGG
jgi:molybdopterin synthase catalytic subunit